MVGTIQPLGKQYPVVNQDGTPTEYFIRWAQQKQIDISGGVAATEVPAIIAEYLADHTLQEGSGIAISPSGNLTDNPTITAQVQEILDQITTTQGSILYRGASSWAALPPGTSGQFLKTMGAGAAPAWGTVSGGGSANLWGFSNAAGTVSTTANKVKGFVFQVNDPITIDKIAMNVDGHGVGTPVDYTLHLVTLSSPTAAGTILSIIESSSPQTVNAATGTMQILQRTLTTPASLVAGTNYAVLAEASVTTARVRFTGTQNVLMVPFLAVAYRGVFQTVTPTVGSAYSVTDVYSGGIRTA